MVDRLVNGTDVISHRLRVAARRYADAHWADHWEDAALSLVIALEAIVGYKNTNTVRKRFARLCKPADREDALPRFKKIYKIRGEVAHGGQPSELDQLRLVRSFASDVRRVARQLDAMAPQSGVNTKKEFNAIFTDLATDE